MADAEAVLLVDHRETEARECAAFLEQRVGAEGEIDLTRGNRLPGLAAFRLALTARDPGTAHAECGERLGELAIMLLGEDFGGRHERGLQAVLDRLQAGQRGDDGLAAADVALQQTAHRVRLRKVRADLLPGARLRRRERERQRGDEGSGEALSRRQRLCDASATLGTRARKRELLRQQFVEGETPPRRMAARFEFGERRIGWRLVQQADARIQCGQAERVEPRGRERVRDRRGKRALDKFAQGRLAEPGGGRVDRSEAARQRRVGVGFREAWMHHLQTEKAAAYLAHETEARTGLEQLDVAGIEVEEADAEDIAAVVADRHGEHAARAIGDTDFVDRGLHLCGEAGAQNTDRGDAGFVFPAQRQVQHQIGVAGEAQLRELVGERRTYRNRKCSRSVQITTMIASASTSAPRGSAATPTAARAG